MAGRGHDSAQLPVPDALARAHSAAVVTHLRDIIDRDGVISLSTYLQLVVHEPGLGYYAVGNQKFGAGGDFVTAPELSPFFGTAVARQVAQVLESIGGDILEFGAGSGALARDVLSALARSDFSGRYLIVEPSAELRQRQQQLLEASLSSALFSQCEWLTSLPSGFTGVMLANEVLDAMPVEGFRIDQGSVKQLFVSRSGDDFELIAAEADDTVTAAVQHLRYDSRRDWIDGYQSEINLLLHPWVQALSASLRQGLLLCIDYGYPRREYYLPERTLGTLRCYYRHHAHNDVFFWPGLQDITSDVDFTLLAEAASAAGLELHGFTTQGQFLLGNGLDSLVQASLGQEPRERLAAAQSLNTLTSMSAMGERFKVMALSRNLEMMLQGFVGVDQSHRL